MTRLNFIAGVSGLELTDFERDYFRQGKPLGLILFARNLKDKEQIRSLVDAVREAVGDDQFWVLIDQEGGRVQRLRPPLFPALPEMRHLGELYEQDPTKALHAANTLGKFMGAALVEFGVNVNCTPVLDVPQPGADDIIGDRSFGQDIDMIVGLGLALSLGHISSGVLPVIKHIPGHGRAEADSHKKLPVITASHDDLSRVDFAPFKGLHEMPLAMTAHVMLDDIDKHAPVSVSSQVISQVIRGEIGFDGFLMSDDVSMQALKGSIGERVQGVLEAGCDGALHCNGEKAEMIEVAENASEISGDAKRRFLQSFELIKQPMPFDKSEGIALLGEEWTGLQAV